MSIASCRRLRAVQGFGRAVALSLAVFTVFAITCPPALAADGGSFTLYSGRKEKAIRPVIEAFQRATGITVKLKVGKTSGLANELLQERTHPQADLFISTEAGIMEVLTKEGILAPLSLPAARLISPLYRSPDGYWVGLSGRARIILYNTKLVKPDQVPISIFQLVDPVWKDKIAIAGTQERTTLSWVSGLVAVKGETATRQYIQGLLKNGLRILPDNTDVWQGVGKGEFAIGLTNSPNYHLALAAGYPVGVVYPDQGSADIGTQVNPIAAALVKGSTRAALATRFVEYLLSPDAQSVLTRQDFEIPLSGGADPGPVKPLAAIRQMEVSQPRLAELADPTLAILTSLSKDW